MKKINICLICGKNVPLSLSYAGEVEVIVTNPLTGKKTLETLVGRVCPSCNAALNYKTSAKKLAKWEGGDN